MKVSEEKEKNANPINDDKFLKTRSILICGEVNKDMAASVARQLLILESESQDPIYVYIDSPGGDVDAGFAIYDMIRFVNNEVFIIGMGLVASAAALILLAADKAHRIGLPNSTYLIHQPLSSMKGVATDLEIYARQLDKIRARLNAIIAQQTGHDEDQVLKDTERDNWMDSDQALAYGLISKAVGSRKEL